TPADGRIVAVETASVIADLERPAAVLRPHSDADRARLGVLAGVLEGLLHDAQDDDLHGLRQGVHAVVDVDHDRHAEIRPNLIRCVLDGATQALLGELGWPQLAEVGADALQLAREDVAQLLELVAGGGPVAVEQALHDVALEYRVPEGRRRAVVDLACEPASLGLLRLDDAHLRVGGARRPARGADEAGVTPGRGTERRS